MDLNKRSKHKCGQNELFTNRANMNQQLLSCREDNYKSPGTKASPANESPAGVNGPISFLAKHHLSELDGINTDANEQSATTHTTGTNL